MLRTAVSLFVLGLVAMLFGAYGIAGISIELGKMLLMVFVILAVISFIAGIVTGKSKRLP